ncbi:MAG TPA: hypothetical protein VHH11_05200 [Gammaproteobacteria bacterium]|nr:hypothetical protein [Gammaproteobacteria bacterium]
MKTLLMLFAVTLSLGAQAAETVLTCVNNDSENDSRQVTIHFDEAAKTFSIYGKMAWSTRHGKDGSAVTSDVTFEQDKITARFKHKGVLWLSLGAGAAGAASARTGVLDRVAGTWTFADRVYQCSVGDRSQPKF